MPGFALDSVSDNLSALDNKLPWASGDFVYMVRKWLIAGREGLENQNLDRRIDIACNRSEDFLLVVVESVAKDDQIVCIIAHKLNCF